MSGRGIAARIALAAVAVAVVAIAIVAAGVVIVGGNTFNELMTAHGLSTASSQAMFDESVVRVIVVASIVAVIVAGVLAFVVSSRLARPLREIAAAARRLAAGRYDARIPRQGPREIAELTDSFNEMAAALEVQDRMRREFVANAAHELRTPLTNLQGYLEALRDGVIPPDRSTFESLWEEAERLVRLARSLDSLGEIPAADPTEDGRAPHLDLADVVRTAVDLAMPAFRAAALDVRLEAESPLPVRADRDRLAEIVGNLLQNAARYAARGRWVEIAARRKGDEVLVSVANEGDAIPAADLPRLFDRFYRVEKSRDRARGGAGIGLAIVRERVEASGGRVGAGSSEGVNTFWFTLPLATDDDAGALPDAPATGMMREREMHGSTERAVRRGSGRASV